MQIMHHGVDCVFEVYSFVLAHQIYVLVDNFTIYLHLEVHVFNDWGKCNRKPSRFIMIFLNI